ncbi:MAG: hypothetical protein EBU33_05935 [Sphingobacteriia bacterium]|nr:hypothetical protein [Sphingobacteriia bacterium]
MKKTLLNGEEVIIIRNVSMKQPQEKGKDVDPKQIVDKEGQWIQVEFVNGPRKGCRIATTKEALTNK